VRIKNKNKNTMKKQLLILTTALLSLSGFAQIPNYVPTNGLVAYYPFNGNADDESGNGFNGTVSNVTLSLDRNGNSNSAYLWPTSNGSGSFIDIGYLHTMIPNSISISSWILSDGGTIQPRIISSGEVGFYTQSTSNISRYYQMNWDRAGTGIWPSSFPVSSGEWHHLVFTADHLNGLAKLYVDGVLTDSSCCGIANPGYVMNDTWNIGRKSTSSYDSWGGKLDDIGIWNRALTTCEIQDLYTAQLNSTFVSAGIDESICNGEQVTLTASGSQNYSWNNGVVNGATFSPTNTLDYIVMVDSAGCQSADTLTVFVNQPTNSTLNETALDSLSLNGQTYNQSGTYTQVIPNAAGCDSTITLNLSLDFTGLQELENSFTISPNPAKDQLNVLSPSGISENYFLLDAQGRKVLAGKLTGTATTIDISKLAAGNYLVQVGEEQMPVRIVKN
jgi:hypothetical protein